MTAEIHAFYYELQNADEVEMNPAQSVRDHLGKLADRHPEVFERAMRKIEIGHEC